MNPLNVANCLVREFQDCSPSPLTTQEEDFAWSLKEVIKQAMEHLAVYIEKIEDLVLEGYGINVNDVEGVEEPDVICELQIDEDYGCSIVGDAYKESAVMYWRMQTEGREVEKDNVPFKKSHSKNRKRRKFSSVQSKYKLVTQESLLYRWEKQIEVGGSRMSKLQRISEHTYAKFLQAKQRHALVHDIDLRRWAFQKAKDIQCLKFKGSKSWCQKFKAKHKIVSRKITKFVSKKDIKDKDQIQNMALDFVLQTQPLVQEYGPENVLNADHCGFAYELHGGRSLDLQGVKKVEIVAQRKHALTHSYTILPTMSASGKLLEPLFVILQEKEGKFGPKVRETMITPPNLLVAASKSGKMVKEHIHEWINGVVMPAAGEKTLILLDAWSAFTDANIQRCVPANKQLQVQHIPEGTTSMIQCWDVYGLRIYKNFTRYISDYVLLHDVPVELPQRDNVLRLQSLIYNQLCSPRFVPLFRYSWFKSGYVFDRPDRFPHPVQFCFLNDLDATCDCDGLKFITCSWCQDHLCFSCFFSRNHLCYDFKE